MLLVCCFAQRGGHDVTTQARLGASTKALVASLDALIALLPGQREADAAIAGIRQAAAQATVRSKAPADMQAVPVTGKAGASAYAAKQAAVTQAATTLISAAAAWSAVAARVGACCRV